MIKVLHIIWSASFGGIERLVHDLAREQADDPRVEPAILIGKQAGEFLDRFEALGVPIHFAGLDGGFDFSSDKFRAVIDVYGRFDVLHFHSFNPLLTRAAVRAGKRIVYTEHGNFGFGRRLGVTDRLRNALLKRFLNSRVDVLSFNSAFTQGVARQRYGLNGVRSAVVYNGIDLEGRAGKLTGAIDPAVQARLDGRFVVGTTSRFAGFKRIDRLIRGFAAFHEGRDAVLMLVGDGVLRGDLEALAERLDLGDKIIFTGYRDNVEDYQQALDVCVFASENEPFGLVAVEALSLGKPTLVFRDGGGIREVLPPEDAADVVADEAALALRLAYYYDHRETIEADAGRRRQRAHAFEVGTMADAFYELYDSLLCAA